MSKKTLSPKKLERMLRVDQAGEYGARRIYAGQLAVLKRRGASAKIIEKIEEMAGQEEAHLEAFNKLVAKTQARPTALQPLWHAGGFALGALTALLGEKAAMAATVAVEEVIDQHYARQSAALEDAPELKKLIDEFRADENRHKQAALAAGAEQAPGYPILRRAVAGVSRAAIWLAERV
jgi:ubiquinone biosynthesis monooxygenase Coq7